jgi:hypothetical protein
VPAPDFSQVSYRLDSTDLIAWDAEPKQLQSIDPRPVRQDTGDNPNETRPETGDIWSQGNFSGGGYQDYYHQDGHDRKKFAWSTGIELRNRGYITLGKAFASKSGLAAAVVGLTVYNDTLYWGQGTNVGKTTDFSVFSTEDPHNGEGAQTVQDLYPEGDRLYAALGSNGAHVRSAAGAWSHFQPAGADLVAGTVTRVLWAKERLFVIGSGGTAIYEATVTSPTSLKTLPTGWLYTDMFEYGPYIYACAVNAASGLSRILHFGLNSAASGMEWVGTTEMPRGLFVYTGIQHFGVAYLGGGIVSRKSGGKVSAFLQASQGPEGTLTYALIAAGDARTTDWSGSSAFDYSVKNIAVVESSLVFGWFDPDTPDRISGVAMYDPATESFNQSFHSGFGVTGASEIAVWRNRVAWVPHDVTTSIYYESDTLFGVNGELATSIADWNNAGDKIWDTVSFACFPLPAGSSIAVAYTTGNPLTPGVTWTTAGTLSTTGGTGATYALGVTSKQLALRFHLVYSTAQTTAPQLLNYSVRSYPYPAREWTIQRHVRIFAEDLLNADADPIFNNTPRTVVQAIMAKLHSQVTFYEPGFTWTGRLKRVAVREAVADDYETPTAAAEAEEGYIATLMLEGTYVAA